MVSPVLGAPKDPMTDAPGQIAASAPGSGKHPVMSHIGRQRQDDVAVPWPGASSRRPRPSDLQRTPAYTVTPDRPKVSLANDGEVQLPGTCRAWPCHQSVRVVSIADACPIDFGRLWTVARKLSFLAPVPAAETREDGVPARGEGRPGEYHQRARLDQPFGPARRSPGWSSRNRSRRRCRQAGSAWQFGLPPENGPGQFDA
jgi:hypothetical protein